MLRLLDKIIFILSIITLTGLLGAYAARYIDPNFLVIPSLSGLAYPYLLVGNILLLLYWTARWKRMALVVLAVIGAGIPFFTSYYGTHSPKQETPSYDLSVLSYNVRFFDKYGWSKDKHTYNKLIDYLNRSRSDLICLQEFPTGNSGIQPETIVKQLSAYRYCCLQKDLAIFSRFPITEKGEISFGKSATGSAIYCDIRKASHTFRIYNIHLESYRLGRKERKFVQEITAGTTDNLSTGVKNILSRLIAANKIRARQALRVQQHLTASSYPAILCGDFNDTPLSYTYHTIGKQLTDSFLEKGHGLGNTYIGEFPSFRIDYIFHSADFITISYTRHNINLSDHYPISCKLKIRS